MAINYSKPFKTYDEQVDHLINVYKLCVSDKDFAIHALKTLSYYDLINGYKECMMDNNIFKPNVTIEYLYMFYLFDKNIQNILLKQSILIENSFKTNLAYVISKNLGIHESDYLDPKKYKSSNGKLQFSSVKTNIEAVFKNNKNIPQPSRYYLDKHNHLPPWILFKNISFSNAINLFTLLKPVCKREVTSIFTQKFSSYTDKNSYILTGINLIRDFRNTMAHNLKFVTHKNKHELSPKTTTAITSKYLLNNKDVYRENRGLNDIYALITLIPFFLNDKYLIYSFFNDITINISPRDSSQNETIKKDIFQDYASITNLPSDLPNRISKYINSLSQ